MTLSRDRHVEVLKWKSVLLLVAVRMQRDERREIQRLAPRR